MHLLDEIVLGDLKAGGRQRLEADGDGEIFGILDLFRKTAENSGLSTFGSKLSGRVLPDVIILDCEFEAVRVSAGHFKEINTFSRSRTNQKVTIAKRN